MRRVVAYRSLFTGLAGVTLLLTITFLAVAPAYRFNYPPLGCGAPAMWHFNENPGGFGITGLGRQGGHAVLQQPTCQELVDQRLEWAAIAGTATVGLLLTSATITRRPRSSRVRFTGLY